MLIGRVGNNKRQNQIRSRYCHYIGKTHIGLGLAACQKGLKVRFITASALVHELIEARDDKRLLRLQKQLINQNLLIIDELGFVPLSKTGAELLFELISQRYERGSIIITSNLPFDGYCHVVELRSGEVELKLKSCCCGCSFPYTHRFATKFA